MFAFLFRCIYRNEKHIVIVDQFQMSESFRSNIQRTLNSLRKIFLQLFEPYRAVVANIFM